MTAFDDRPSGTPEFYAGLPAKPSGAGCLFFDIGGRVLLVKPTYKERWEVPGGVVEDDESPFDACRREIAEELGLTRRPERLLAVDYRRPVAGVRGDALRFLFAGGVLTDAEVAGIRLPLDELSEWRFVAIEDLDDYVIPAMARRIRAAVSAPACVYLEEGRDIRR